MATEEVEVMYFLLSYTSNLSYIYPIFSSKKILYSYIIFVKSGLTPWIYHKELYSVDILCENSTTTMPVSRGEGWGFSCLSSDI